jgi:hypothetical protein
MTPPALRRGRHRARESPQPPRRRRRRGPANERATTRDEPIFWSRPRGGENYSSSALLLQHRKIVFRMSLVRIVTSGYVARWNTKGESLLGHEHHAVRHPIEFLIEPIQGFYPGPFRGIWIIDVHGITVNPCQHNDVRNPIPSSCAPNRAEIPKKNFQLLRRQIANGCLRGGQSLSLSQSSKVG